MTLKDKVALVTGGASGLGRASAKALSDAGAKVFVVDIDGDGAQETAESLDGYFHQADVSKLDQNREMMAAAVEAFGSLDYVFLNAGVATGFSVDESFDEERYRQVMGVNLDGVVFGTHAALATFDRERGGAIVATASLAGLTAVPFDPLYAANKHAVVGLARSLGPILVERKVRFNAVCPGFAQSKIIEPIREMLQEMNMPIIPAERVAETVVNLFAGDMTGECWFVQAGRDSAAFDFRNIPGPRIDDGETPTATPDTDEVTP